MSKASQIRDLLSNKSKNYKEIADIVGTSIGYVEQIASDLRTGGGETKRLRHAQIKYRSTKTGQRNIDRKRNYAKGRGNAESSGEQWSGEHEKLVLSFSGTDRELANEIGRSVQAIQFRRNRLQKEGV